MEKQIEISHLLDMIVSILEENEMQKFYKNRVEYYFKEQHQLISTWYITTDVEKTKTSSGTLLKEYPNLKKFENFIFQDNIFVLFYLNFPIINMKYDFFIKQYTEVNEMEIGTQLQEQLKLVNRIYENYIFDTENPSFKSLFNKYPYLKDELNNKLLEKKKRKLLIINNKFQKQAVCYK